jgi:serine/threonine protein kinase
MKANELSPRDSEDFYLGSGTYSVVYSCGGSAKKIASGTDIDLCLDQLKKEIEVYLTCQHPNIVHLLSWGPDFIIMTLMDGDLIHMRAFKRKIFETRKIKILLDVAKGLKHMHSVGWAHGDLSQNNILYKLENNELSCRICDMGFATNQRILDLEGAWPGTYVYMDYEGMTCSYYHSLKACFLTDIWSLGNLAGFLYFGKSFTHIILNNKGLSTTCIQNYDTVVDVMQKSTQEEYDDITKLCKIHTIVASIMRIVPEERSNLDQIIEMLDSEN